MPLLNHFANVIRCRMDLSILSTNVGLRQRLSELLHFRNYFLVFLEVAEIFSNSLGFKLPRELESYILQFSCGDFLHNFD